MNCKSSHESMTRNFFLIVVGSVDYNSSFAEYGQKFSICHTFLVPLPSAMANDRPSGDGIAYRM
jgi:hypothetical protein